MASPDERPDGTYTADDGTIFDTRYRGSAHVYLTEDQTIVVKPDDPADADAHADIDE